MDKNNSFKNMKMKVFWNFIELSD